MFERLTAPRANIAHAVEAQAERERLAAQRAAFAGHKSTEGPSQFGRVTGQPAALSRPQSMVRDALVMGGCPHRALAMIADDDLSVARQLLADAMEGRRE